MEPFMMMLSIFPILPVFPGIPGRMEPLEKKWVTNEEAQAYLGVSKGFMQNLREKGKLPYYKVGSVVFYRVEDIDRLIEDGKVV